MSFTSVVVMFRPISLTVDLLSTVPGFQHAHVLIWERGNDPEIRVLIRSNHNGEGRLNPHNLPIKLLRRRKKTLLKYFSLSIRHDGRMFVKWIYWWIPHRPDLTWKCEARTGSVLSVQTGRRIRNLVRIIRELCLAPNLPPPPLPLSSLSV